MHTVRTLSGSLRDILDPTHRILHFEDDGAVVLVLTLLRYAWTALPPAEDPTADSVGVFTKAKYRLSDDERKNAVPQNADKDSVHTPWRDKVYHQWNHVFHDIMGMLMEVGMVGHFHPPSHDIMAIKYPLPEASNAKTAVVTALKKTWDTNVLLIPAYLEPGVSIRASIADPESEGSGKTVGTFDVSNPAEIWYVRSGVEVESHVEGDFVRECEGVAAVLAVGILCSEDHEDEKYNEQSAEARVVTTVNAHAREAAS